MNKKKFLRGSRKLSIAMITIITATVILAGSALAWLYTTKSLENTFSPASMGVEIHEDFNDTTKSNVYIENTSTVPAYIRVALVPTWEDSDENVMPLAASLDDLIISRSTDVWFEHGGYYYCKMPVDAGELTPKLIDTATVKTASGYIMNLQILAECIQSAPSNAVESAWNVSVDADGQLRAS